MAMIQQYFCFVFLLSCLIIRHILGELRHIWNTISFLSIKTNTKSRRKSTADKKLKFRFGAFLFQIKHQEITGPPPFSKKAFSVILFIIK